MAKNPTVLKPPGIPVDPGNKYVQLGTRPPNGGGKAKVRTKAPRAGRKERGRGEKTVSPPDNTPREKEIPPPLPGSKYLGRNYGPNYNGKKGKGEAKEK